MTTKTITVTEDAYEALKELKLPNASFSETILHVAKRRPLKMFYGALTKRSANKLEGAILELRKLRNKIHNVRIKDIVEEFQR